MKNIAVIILFLALVLNPGQAWPDYNPLPGGDLLYDLFSPAMLSTGSPLTALDAPSAAFNNPAAAGFLQRTTAEINYTALNGNNEDEGWGNAVFAGLSMPGKAGVLTSSLFFINSDFSALETGTMTGANISFSKDLYDNLSAGAGITAGFGNNGSYDWLLAADLGFIHYPEIFLNSKNFRWAGVIKNIGKGYAPRDSYSSSPSVFSPGIGAGLTLYESSKFSADFTSDALFPSFQNLRVDSGASFGIGSSVRLNLSARMDVKNFLDNDVVFTSFVPSVGFSFGFKTDLENLNIEALKKRDWNKTDFIADFAVAGIGENLQAFSTGLRIPFGVKDSEGPDIAIDYKKTHYISPDNDGAQDKLILPFSLSDKRYVKGYEFIISDSEGNEVRKYLNKEDRPENVTFKNIIERAKYIKTGINVPEALEWDGTDEERITVPDGIYSFQVRAWDDNNNISVSDVMEVAVDTEAPAVEIDGIPADDRIFSPNGDGSKDLLTIRQEGSLEDYWLGEITDNRKNIVRTFEWHNSAPEDIFWEGTDDKDIVLPDGVYTYRITGRDRAGNETVLTLDNIIISNIQTPADLRIDTPAFSPDGDGVKDYLNFVIDVPVKTFVQSWTLDILTPDDRISATFEGFDSVPDDFRFDGRTQTDILLAEGLYRGRLTVVYKNGNMPEVFSPLFEIDITPPAASAKAQYSVFSPDGDGNKDVLVIEQNASSEEDWYADITDKEGNKVYSITWKNTVPQRFIWDGIAESGKPAFDGEYHYRLFTTDPAGNTGSSERIMFSIDTEETPVILSREYEAFSPDNNGVKDKISFYTQVKRKEGIERYLFEIKNEEGNAVFERRGTGSVPQEFVWDGRDNTGSVKDGRYTAAVDVLYINGNNPVSETPHFIIDTVFPHIDIEPEYYLFSPNGDNRKDNLRIKVNNASSENLWEGAVKDSSGRNVRTFYREGVPPDFVWDGRDNTGNLLPDGKYSFAISSRDPAGNFTEKSISNIIIDNRPVQVLISIDKEGFSPNKDGMFDSIRFDIITIPNEALESWELTVKDTAKKVSVKSFSGTETIPRSIVWDGSTDLGTAPDNIYNAEITAVYKKGDKRVSETRPFILDNSPPVPEIVMTPIPFSPDNDGVDDELFIMISLKDLSSIKDWRLDINDPYGTSFKKYSGRGMPSGKIVWDGYSDGGELVQAAEDYPFVFTSSDILGNTSSMTGKIPVDVLVVRDGDNLKIKISSINFAPNSPELVTDIPEIKEKNEKIIDRLAEILNKYSTYKIKIEGHANNMSWYDPAKAAVEEVEELAPLSAARCETVRDLLVKRGVEESRMSMIGMGGSSPIVPFSDPVNRWKNRRVEFILIK